MVLLWALARVSGRRSATARLDVVVLPWHLVIAAVLGSLVLSVMAEHRLDSPLFLLNLRDALPELLRPMNQAAHPFYALRVALTFVEGWLVFLLVVDVCRLAPDPARRARVALAGWCGGLAVVSAFAVFQYLTRFQLHPYWVKANPHIVRAHATLEDPNALGAFLVLGVGLFVALLRLGTWPRPIVTALLMLTFAGLVTTMSRAALAGAVMAPLLVLAFVRSPAAHEPRALRVAAQLAVVAIAVIVGGSLAVRALTTERTRTQPASPAALIAGTLDPRESADWVFRRRLSWWRAAGAMLLERPLTGIGLGRFPRLKEEYGGGPVPENTHNLFLQFFAEAGIVGGLAFGAFILGWCGTFLRRVRREARGPEQAMALGGLIACLALATTLLTGHSLLLPSGQILWASFLALVTTLACSPAQTAAATPRGLSKSMVALGIVLMVAWYPIVSQARGITPRVGPWGYTWGLYPEEQADAAGRFRWTSGRAALDLELPAGATALELRLAVPSPVRQGQPVQVRLTTRDWMRDVTFSGSDAQWIRVPATSDRLQVQLAVSPTLLPSRDDPPSSDDRVLGVQLFEPRVISPTAPESPQ